MADVNANIGVNIDTSGALAQLKLLQREIARFQTSVARSSENAALAQRDLQKNFINGVNAIQGFSAELRTVRTTAENFTDSLERNKFSMREYFRYSAASTKTFGRFFKSEFDTINKVAVENVKRLQTQYIKMGRDANGTMKAIAIMPTKLDMSSMSTQMQMAAQRQAIFNQLVKQGSTNLLNFGKNTQWAGRQLMVGFTIPLIGLGSVASRTFMDMETAAIKFRKVYGDLFTPTEETQFALESIQALGREFTKYGIAVSETVSLAAEAAAAGFAGADLQAQVEQATRLQVLGQVEQQQALETTISLQNAFRISSNDLADAINFLNAVENQTVVSLEDITIAIPKAAPIVRDLGGDVKDLAFFMAAMKEGGINASQGANALKSGLSALINPTEKAKETLQSLGIDITDIVERNVGNLRGTIIEFAEALDGLSKLNQQRVIAQLFGRFQQARLSALFDNVIRGGNQAARVLDLASASTADLAALAEKELGITADSAMNQFRGSVEQLKVSLVPLGQAFLEVITPLLQKINALIEWFNGLSDNTKKVMTKVLLYVGGLGPVLLMTIGLMANFVANGIKGLLLLRTGFLRLTGQSKVLSEQTNYLTTQQQEALAAAASLDQAHMNLQQTFNGEAESIKRLIGEYQRMIIAQNTAAARFPAMMQPGYKPKGYNNGIVSVPGPKGAGDVIPAMVSPGEAIIPASLNEKYAPLVQGIIADNIPGFNGGTLSVAERFIASNAPQITGLSKGKTPSEFLAAELRRVPEELKESFMELVSGITQETNISLTELKERLKEFRSQYNANIGPRTEKIEFGHIGSGQAQTAQDLLASNRIVHQGSLSRLQTIARVLPDKEIGLKSGYGVDMRGDLNDALDKAGANLSDFINDFNENGIEKWKTTVKVGGGNFDELADQITNYDQQMSSALQQRLDSGARLIFDTKADIEEAKATAIAKGEQFDETVAVSLEEIDTQLRNNIEFLGTELNQVFTNALNTITEGRFDITDAEEALLRAELGDEELARLMGGAGRKSARITPGGTKAGRRFRGLGNFEEIPNEIIDDVARGAGTRSPSVKTIPIGEDIMRGLEVGMENQIQETKNVAANASGAVVSGLIDPKTGKPFGVANIAEKVRLTGPQVAGMAKPLILPGQQAPTGPLILPGQQQGSAGPLILPGGQAPSGPIIIPSGTTAPSVAEEVLEKPLVEVADAVKENSEEVKKTTRFSRARGAVSKGVGKITGAGGGFGLSGLVFAMSMLPGKFGELAKSITPAIFAMQSLGMLSRIIGPIPTAIVGLGAALYTLNKKATEAAEGLVDAANMEAEARYGSAKSIKEFADFTGQALPSAREFTRNNRQLISASGEAVKRFQEFYAQDNNRSTQVINAAALKGEGAGMRAAAIDVAQRAAMFNLEPSDIAANIKAAADLIGADQVELKAKVQEILAPNGQDITREPLTVKARMEFLQRESEEAVRAIEKNIVKLSKIELPGVTAPGTKDLLLNSGVIGTGRRLIDIGKRVRGGETLDSAATTMSYQELKQSAGWQKSINDSYGGGLFSEAFGATKQLGRNILGFGYDVDVTKEFNKIQSAVSSSTMQLSIAFTQQKESLALLNQQYADGIITKEEYDAQMNVSSSNFAELAETSKTLIDELDKIDTSGELSASALKDLGNEAFAALKKSNPALFKKISKSMEDLDAASQIDIMMGYAQGSLTILDVAKLPELLKEIDGKSIDVAINILAKSGVTKAVLESDIRDRLAVVDKTLKNWTGPTEGPEAVQFFSLQSEKKKLEKDLKDIEEMKKVGQGSFDSDGKPLEDGAGDGKFEAFKKELAALKKKLSVLQDINKEMDRQNQYQMKQMDLINQASRAKISGNFLEAAQLQQQSMLEGAKFAQESQEIQLERLISLVSGRGEKAEDRGGYNQKDLALLKQLREKNYESIIPTPTTPGVGFNAGATGFAGSTTNVGGAMYTVTMNISGENANEIANKVINKLNILGNKKNKTNKVR